VFKDAIKRLKEKGKIVPFNRAIAEGVGYTQAKDGIHERVNTILRRELTHDRDSNPRLPEGLAYIGYRFMSPFESFIFKISRQDSRSGRGKAPIPIAETDTYMIGTRFRIPGEGKVLTRPMYLPFIRRGGLMNYWGTSYHVAPVIHQPGICQEHNGLFVNFDFTRKVSLKFAKHPVKVLVNGRKEELYIPGTSNLYTPKNPTGHDADEKPLVYWLFGKYGFSQAIKRYTGVDVEIIPAYKVPEVDLDEFVVISSGADPRVSRTIQYALKVPVSAFPNISQSRWEQDEHALLVTCGAFFKAAHYYASKQNSRSGLSQLTPLFTKLDEFSQEEDLANLNSAEIWKEILGRSIMGTKTSDVELHRSMTTHFVECGRYVNDTFRGELMVSDPDIDPDMDMFDFLFYSTKLMIRTRLTRQEDIPSMFGKRLTVVDYLLLGAQGFTSTVSRIRWKLEGLDDKSPESCGTTVKGHLNKDINHNLVTRSITSNGAISFFNASTESMVLAVSTHAISQTETDNKKKKGGKTVNLNDRTKHASASHAVLGNIYYIPKSSPYKYGILSQYMQTSRNLVMTTNPKLEATVRETQDDISKIGR
jgi:hypothetical protein